MNRWSYRETEDKKYEILAADGTVLLVVSSQPEAFRIVADANKRYPTIH